MDCNELIKNYRQWYEENLLTYEIYNNNILVYVPFTDRFSDSFSITVELCEDTVKLTDNGQILAMIDLEQSLKRIKPIISRHNISLNKGSLETECIIKHFPKVFNDFISALIKIHAIDEMLTEEAGNEIQQDILG